MALGVMENIPYDRGKLVMDNGDVLVLYTDGVTEAMNTANEMFGGNGWKSPYNHLMGLHPGRL